MPVSNSCCDKIAQPDRLTLLAIRSDERRKSLERAHLTNAGKFNRQYLTCHQSAILYANRGYQRIKSPGVSQALETKKVKQSSLLVHNLLLFITIYT